MSKRIAAWIGAFFSAGALFLVAAFGTRSVEAEDFVPSPSLDQLLLHLSNAQTVFILFTDQARGYEVDRPSFLWLAADRATGRGVVYLFNVGIRGTAVYVLDDGTLTRYRLQGLYDQPEVPVVLEFGTPASQVAEEAFTGFSNSTFSNDGGFVKVALPFSWATWVDMRFHPARLFADPQVDLPGSLTISAGGKRTTFLIQDALWDVDLPPSFFEDSSEAMRATRDAVLQWLAEGRLRHGLDPTPSL